MVEGQRKEAVGRRVIGEVGIELARGERLEAGEGRGEKLRSSESLRRGGVEENCRDLWRDGGREGGREGMRRSASEGMTLSRS